MTKSGTRTTYACVCSGESLECFDRPNQWIQLMQITCRPHDVHARSGENHRQLTQSTWVQTCANYPFVRNHLEFCRSTITYACASLWLRYRTETKKNAKKPSAAKIAVPVTSTPIFLYKCNTPELARILFLMTGYVTNAFWGSKSAVNTYAVSSHWDDERELGGTKADT